MTEPETHATPGLRPASDPLLPRLSDEQLVMLAAVGRSHTLDAGALVFEKGQRDFPFVVLRSGSAELFERESERERSIGTLGARTFLGDVALFTGAPAIVSCRISQGPATVITLSRAQLLTVCGDNQEIADMVLTSSVARRQWLTDHGHGQARVIGSGSSPLAFQVRELLDRNHVPHQWLDIEDSSDDAALVESLNVAEDLPVVIDGQTVLRRPTLDAVAVQFGLRGSKLPTACDLIIIGAGPAGLAAALYAASEGLDTLCFDSFAPGGQAGTSTRIENYLGFPAGISGTELAARAAIQARRLGARFSSCHEVIRFDRAGDCFRATLADGQEIASRAVLLATGARYRTLKAPGIEQLIGSGVYPSASNLNALQIAGREVVVVGGGNSAGQATLALARHASEVHLVVRKPDLAAGMSAYLIERIEHHPSITVHTAAEVSHVYGSADRGLTRVELLTGHGEKESVSIAACALFAMIGADPNNGPFAHLVECDAKGFVRTGLARTRQVSGSSTSLQTSQPGVFAAGDIRSGATNRVATAVGDGAVAIREIYDYLNTNQPQLVGASGADHINDGS